MKVLILLLCYVTLSWGFIPQRVVFDLETHPHQSQYEFWMAEVPGIPDGYPRSVYGLFPSRNYSLYQPFPVLIRVRDSDTVRVTIHNDLPDKRVAMHWHGLHMVGNPWMDGVDTVTECGIPAGGSFTYVYNLTQTGTYWFHSHSGSQYVDGLLGALIIDHADQNDDPVYRAFPYTTEHMLVIQDWFHETSMDLEIFYRGPDGAYPGFYATFPWTHHNLLINGQGNFHCNFSYNVCNETMQVPEVDSVQCLVNREPFFGDCVPDYYLPQVFHCDANGYTRLRFVNTGNNLALVVWIDGHNMTVVAKDGSDVVPKEVDFFTLHVSQRIDVIVHCNNNPLLDYKIHVAIAYNFIPLAQNLVNLTTSAILTYNKTRTLAAGANPNYATPTLTFDEVSDRTRQYFEYQFVPLGLTEETEMFPAADYCFEIPIGQAQIGLAGWPSEEWLLNGTSYLPSTIPFLQADWMNISVKDIKQFENVITPVQNFTRSTNVISLEYGKIYQFVFVSGGPAPHPLHIHGYWVDFVDFTAQPDPRLQRCGGYNKSAQILARGDSFVVPYSGTVTFRFKADNVGPWFFHCHIEWHMRLGMALTIDVRDNGTYQGHIVEPPPDARVCIDYQQLATLTNPNPPPTTSGRASSSSSGISTSDLQQQPPFIALEVITVLLVVVVVVLVYLVWMFRNRSLKGQKLEQAIPLTEASINSSE